MYDMLSIILSILLISIVVEAITEIITTSSIFEPLRLYIKQNAYTIPPNDKILGYILMWLDKLLSCGYCVSVWVSALTVSVSNINLLSDNLILGKILCIFLVHRISNWIHVIYELIRKGRIKEIELNMSFSDPALQTNFTEIEEDDK